MATTNVFSGQSPSAGAAPAAVSTETTPGAVRAVLGPGGVIARRLPGYEPRPEQLAMAEAVADAITSRSHLIVEAGTGVGKSFAYLVPAILDAVASRKKVVVSTHTINLQEQLLLKDIPFLQGVMPSPFDAVLVKGRGNYLSLRRLRSAREKGRSLFDLEEEVRQVERVGAWAGTTTDGSRSDLDFQPLPVVWEEVRSDRDNCQGKKCPTHRECFYHAARRRMEAAQVVIVNHAVYLTDLALRREGTSFLPDHDVAIFDEAHTLEGVASDHLGETISSGQVADLLARVAKLPVPEDVRDLVEPTWGHALEFFDAVLEVRGREPRGDLPVPRPTGWTDRLAEALRRLGSKLLERSASEKDADAKLDIEARGKRAVALAGTLATWLGQEKPGCVYWSEARRGKGTVPKVSLTYAPIHVGPSLRAELFAKVPTCILTSATLAVGSPRASTTSPGGSAWTMSAPSRWAARSTIGTRSRCICRAACPTRPGRTAGAARTTNGRPSRPSPTTSRSPEAGLSSCSPPTRCWSMPPGPLPPGSPTVAGPSSPKGTGCPTPNGSRLLKMETAYYSALIVTGRGWTSRARRFPM